MLVSCERLKFFPSCIVWPLSFRNSTAREVRTPPPVKRKPSADMVMPPPEPAHSPPASRLSRKASGSEASYGFPDSLPPSQGASIRRHRASSESTYGFGAGLERRPSERAHSSPSSAAPPDAFACHAEEEEEAAPPPPVWDVTPSAEAAEGVHYNHDELPPIDFLPPPPLVDVTDPCSIEGLVPPPPPLDFELPPPDFGLLPSPSAVLPPGFDLPPPFSGDMAHDLPPPEPSWNASPPPPLPKTSPPPTPPLPNVSPPSTPTTVSLSAESDPRSHPASRPPPSINRDSAQKPVAIVPSPPAAVSISTCEPEHDSTNGWDLPQSPQAKKPLSIAGTDHAQSEGKALLSSLPPPPPQPDYDDDDEEDAAAAALGPGAPIYANVGVGVVAPAPASAASAAPSIVPVSAASATPTATTAAPIPQPDSVADTQAPAPSPAQPRVEDRHQDAQQSDADIVPKAVSARATHGFEARYEDELTFAVGDLVTLLRTPPGGWWEGRMKGATGWFPSNHVQQLPIQALPTSEAQRRGSSASGLAAPAKLAPPATRRPSAPAVVQVTRTTKPVAVEKSATPVPLNAPIRTLRAAPPPPASPPTTGQAPPSSAMTGLQMAGQTSTPHGTTSSAARRVSTDGSGEEERGPPPERLLRPPSSGTSPKADQRPLEVASHPSGNTGEPVVWTIAQVGRLLDWLGLPQYQTAFAENEITGSLFLELDASDLKELGVQVLGHRKTLLKAVQGLAADPRWAP